MRSILSLKRQAAWILLFVIQSCLIINGQDTIDFTPDFISPVNHPLKLSGTFGELRSHHFHAGIDIKSTDGTSGDPIYAVASGWISRIKVEGGGYGQALYIDHPNGLRTVYGHLDAFTPDIEKMIRDSQYLYQSFEVDLHFERGEIPVQEAEKVAEMGNKGYSYGPHLHFEVRNAKNDVPYNPLLFNLPVEDHRPPEIDDIKIAYINNNLKITDRKSVALNRIGNQYLRKQNVNVKAGTPFSFTIKTTDRQEGTHNHNGIYNIKLFADSSLLYTVQMDSIPYSVNRAMDGYIDYGFYQLEKERYHSTLYLPGNPLPIYPGKCIGSIREMEEEEKLPIKIEVSDFYGNTSTATFQLEANVASATAISRSINYILPWNLANEIERGRFSVFLPKYALYSDLYAYITTVTDGSDGYLSPVLQFHNKDIPLFKPMTIKYYYPQVNDSLRSKMIIASCNQNDIENHGSQWSGDTLIARTRKMGNYTVMVDTIAPTIKALRAAKYPGNSYRFIFEIDDNYSTGRYIGSTKIWAEIDGKWHLGEEVAKYDRFYVPVPNKKTDKWHILKIYAEDVMGNLRVEKRKFYF